MKNNWITQTIVRMHLKNYQPTLIIFWVHIVDNATWLNDMPQGFCHRGQYLCHGSTICQLPASPWIQSELSLWYRLNQKLVPANELKSNLEGRLEPSTKSGDEHTSSLRHGQWIRAVLPRPSLCRGTKRISTGTTECVPKGNTEPHPILMAGKNNYVIHTLWTV